MRAPGELFELPPALPPHDAEALASAPGELRTVIVSAPVRRRAVLKEFAARWTQGADGPRILAAYVRHARQRVKERPACRLSSDRFGHGVLYVEGLEVTNNLIPLFVAAVAMAAPELVRNIAVRTAAAALLRQCNWKPSIA